MSIVPASGLSRADLSRLSNNMGRAKRPSVGERVAALYPAAAPVGGLLVCR
jgi:hypothetical protein